MLNINSMNQINFNLISYYKCYNHSFRVWFGQDPSYLLSGLTHVKRYKCFLKRYCLDKKNSTKN